MDAKETNKLIKLAQSGDEDARRKLIENNMRLVTIVFKRSFSGLLDKPEFMSYHKEDIMQVGAITINRAIDAFDESKGFAFSTLACSSLSREFSKYKRDKMYPFKTPVKYPELTKLYNTICEEESGRKLTQDELAEKMGIERYELAEFLSVSFHTSLDRPMYDDTEATMSEVVPSPETPILESIVVKEALHKAIDTLKDEDKKIITMYYMDGYDLDEIGDEIGRIRNSVYSRKQFLLTKLRRLLLQEGVQWEEVQELYA